MLVTGGLTLVGAGLGFVIGAIAGSSEGGDLPGLAIMGGGLVGALVGGFAGALVGGAIAS